MPSATTSSRGMVRCCAGHQPLSMQGKARRGHHYYACGYAAGYGDDAAPEAHAGQKIDLCSRGLARAARPALLRAANLRAAAPRAAGEAVARPGSRASARDGKLAGTRSSASRSRSSTARSRRRSIAFEDGIEPELVSRAHRRASRRQRSPRGSARRRLALSARRPRTTSLLASSTRVPDLTKSLARGRAGDQAPGLRRPSTCRSPTTRSSRRIEISATVSEAVADAFENAKALQKGSVVGRGHSGGGIRTRDLRVMSPTSYLAAPPRGVCSMLATGAWLKGGAWRSDACGAALLECRSYVRGCSQGRGGRHRQQLDAAAGRRRCRRSGSGG